jgi:hypothetical protein
MIAALRPFASRALLLLDLERHPLAYWFIPLTRRLLKWSELTVHDGTVSVASAFRLEELVSLACDAGASEIAARQHRPWFRISVTIPANAPEIHSAASPLKSGGARLPQSRPWMQRGSSQSLQPKR